VGRGKDGRLFVLQLVEAAQGFLHPVKLLQGGIFLAPGFYLPLLSRLESLFAHQEKLAGDLHFRAFLLVFPSFIQAVIGIVNQMKMVDHHHVRLGQRLFHRPEQKPVHIDTHFPDLLLLLLWDAVEELMERLLPGIGQECRGGMSAQVGDRVNKL